MKNGEPVNQAKMLIFLSAIYVHVLDFPLKNEDELNLSNRWPMIVKSVAFSVLSTASKARVNRNLQPYILEFLSENQFDFSLSSYDLCSSQSPVSHPGP